jgi:hypothetical protein
MQSTESYVNERLDHLGIVAGVCEEIGIAVYVDQLAGLGSGTTPTGAI